MSAEEPAFVSGIVGLCVLYALATVTDPELAVTLLSVAAFFMMFNSSGFPAILARKIASA
jgi:ACS family D-galactonate transporter-like MFS transporter